MAEKIHEFANTISGPDGSTYVVRVFAEERGNVWIGWLEFRPAKGKGLVLRTGEETSQPNKGAVEYWASGLEPVYLEGALLRARKI